MTLSTQLLFARERRGLTRPELARASGVSKRREQGRYQALRERQERAERAVAAEAVQRSWLFVCD